MDEKRLAFLRSTLHPLLSILTPFLFLTAIDAMLRALFLDVLAGPPPWGYRIVLLAVGAVETLSANALVKARATGLAPRVREAVLLFAAVGLVLHLLSGAPFHGRFTQPAPGAFWALFLAVLQWAFTLAMHRVLIGRELFLSLLQNKADGRALANAAREAGGEAGAMQEGFQTIRTGLVLAMVVVILILFASLIAGAGLGAWIPLYDAVAVAAGIGLLAFLRQCDAEHAAFTDGMPFPPALRRRRTQGLLAILAALFLAALLLSGNHEILPLSMLVAFFDWLNRALTPPQSAAPPPPPQKPQAPAAQGDNSMDLLHALGAQKENPLIASIVRALGIAIGAALVAAFLFFLVRPLLSRDTRAAIRRARPLAFLARKAGAFLSGIRRAAAAAGSWLRSPRTRSAGIARAAILGIRDAAARRREAAGTEDGRTRARETGRAVREYARLIRWGRRIGVGFHPAFGPAAYAAALGDAVPQVRQALAAAASLFEELVYSPRGEDPALLASLARAVAGIVRTRPERKGNGS